MSARRENGFTLIELLVAMGLGIVLSFGLIQIFQNTRDLANTETSLSRVQEIGRYALDEVVEEIRMSGYIGCADPDNFDLVTVANDVAQLDWKAERALGYEVLSSGTMVPALPANSSLKDVQTGTSVGSIEARPGSDVIQVIYGERETSTPLMENVEDYGDVILGPPNDGAVTDKNNGNPRCLDTGDLVLIGDCNKATIFENTNDTCDVDGKPIYDAEGHVTFGMGASRNTYTDRTESYVKYTKGAGTFAFTFREISFFVADTGRTTSSGDNVYALYRMLNGNAPEELVEGVEYLQIQYGEVVGDNVRYVSAGAGLDMSNVSSVRIGMLVQGTESSLIENDTHTYNIAGTDILATGTFPHGGGRYLRKPFVTTVKIRNRR